MDETIIGAMTTAEFDYCYKCGLFFTDKSLIAVRLGNKDEGITEENYATWLRVVQGTNASKTPLVYYDIKSLPASPLSETQTLLYGEIKGVSISAFKTGTKDPLDSQYVINFSTGIMAYYSYLIPAATLNEALNLLSKTPLADKVKQTK